MIYPRPDTLGVNCSKLKYEGDCSFCGKVENGRYFIVRSVEAELANVGLKINNG